MNIIIFNESTAIGQSNDGNESVNSSIDWVSGNENRQPNNETNETRTALLSIINFIGFPTLSSPLV